jgi:hypothetical protein
VDLAENFLYVPQSIHHGEMDNVVVPANSRNMAKRLRELEYDYVYKEYPGVGHSVPVDSARLSDWMMMHAKDPMPTHVIYKTISLRHNKAYWVRIDRMADPGVIAEIDATVKPGNRIEVKTKNVEGFTLTLPSVLAERGKPLTTVIDGKEQTHSTFEVPDFSLLQVNGVWQSPPNPMVGLFKNHDTPGLLDDVFSGKFLYVYGTVGDSSETEMNRSAAMDMRDRITGADGGQFMGNFKVVKDTEVTKEDILGANLILVGRPRSNRITAEIEDKLPIRFDGKTVKGVKNFSGGDLMVRFIYPNPKNQKRYVVVNYAGDPKMLVNMKWQRWMSPDYLIMRMNPTGDAENPYEVLEAGLFDTRWQLSNAHLSGSVK